MKELRQSTAFTFRAGPFLDETDGKTIELALTLVQADIQISKAGGVFAQTSAALPTTTYDSLGHYQCPLTTTDTATLGLLRVVIHKSGALPVWEDFMVVTANVWDSKYSTDKLEVDVAQIGGGTQSATDLKDFADAGYDPATKKVQGVVLVDTSTANTDMRGTDSGATAANLATVDSVVAAIKLVTDLLPDAGALSDLAATLVDTNEMQGKLPAGTIASSAETVAIQNNTRVRVIIPGTLERPDSGSTLYQLDLYIYDTDGNMEAPDSPPTITAENEAGVDRSSGLGTVTLVSTGRYSVTYAVASGHAIEQIRFAWSIIEGGATRLQGASTQIVDTTAVDFTAADRTKLDTLHDTRLTAARATNLDNLDVAVSTRSTVTTAEVNTECDNAIETYHLDRLFAVDYDPAAKPGVATALLNELVENDGGVSRLTANALELAPVGGGGGETQLRADTAQAGGASTITLDVGASATNDHYKHAVCAITGGTGTGQSQIIDSYVGSTRVATMAAAWAVQPDNTSTFVILPLGTIPGATAPSAAVVATAVWAALRAANMVSGSMGEAVYRIHANVANKKIANKATGATKLHEDDQATLLLTRTIQAGASDDEVDSVVA